MRNIFPRKYRYNYTNEADEILKNISTIHRSVYPGVSYEMIEGIISGTMSIVPSASKKQVITLPITGDNFLQIENFPILRGLIAVHHDGNKRTIFVNNTPYEIIWKASFMGKARQRDINGHTSVHDNPLTIIITY